MQTAVVKGPERSTKRAMSLGASSQLVVDSMALGAVVDPGLVFTCLAEVVGVVVELTIEVVELIVELVGIVIELIELIVEVVGIVSI